MTILLLGMVREKEVTTSQLIKMHSETTKLLLGLYRSEDELGNYLFRKAPLSIGTFVFDYIRDKKKTDISELRNVFKYENDEKFFEESFLTSIEWVVNQYPMFCAANIPLPNELRHIIEPLHKKNLDLGREMTLVLGMLRLGRKLDKIYGELTDTQECLNKYPNKKH